MEIRISPDFKIVAGMLSRVQTEIVSRIIDGSAQQVKEIIESRTKAEVPVKSGVGRDSVHAEVTQSSRGRSARISVYGLDRLKFVKLGTRPHLITASTGRMLAWLQDNGTIMFAHSVMHPGQQPNDFVARGWSAAEPEVRNTLREAGLRGWRDLAHFR